MLKKNIVAVSVLGVLLLLVAIRYAYFMLYYVPFGPSP